MAQAKFGSVAWQDQMIGRIEAKLEAKQELEPYEQAFLEVQAEHNHRILEGVQ